MTWQKSDENDSGRKVGGRRKGEVCTIGVNSASVTSLPLLLKILINKRMSVVKKRDGNFKEEIEIISNFRKL